VNRSGKDHLEFPSDPKHSWPIISLADIEARTWDTIEEARKWYVGNDGDAQLLEAVRPKDNWALLTGR